MPLPVSDTVTRRVPRRGRRHDLDAHLPARRRELERVVDQVRDDLRDPVGVDEGFRQVGGELLLELDPSRVGPSREAHQGAVDERRQRRRDLAYGEPAGLHARDVQDVVQAGRHLIAPFLHVSEVLDLRRRELAREPVDEDRDELARGRQRRLQLVRERVVEAPDLLVLLLEILVHPLEAQAVLGQRDL
jgi:hypothetical protein